MYEPSIIDKFLNSKFFEFKYFNPEYLFNHLVLFLQWLVGHVFQQQTVDILKFFASCLSLFFMTIIAYCAVRMLEIRKKEHKYLHHEIEEYAHHQAEREHKKAQGDDISKNENWLAVLRHLYEPNQSDWKLAIIEADTMMLQLMEQIGYKGETLGERLKDAADSGKFRNLNLAWEVHAIRNRIAHEGLSFSLSLHEAKRVIAIYELIFREYGFI